MRLPTLLPRFLPLVGLLGFAACGSDCAAGPDEASVRRICEQARPYYRELVEIEMEFAVQVIDADQREVGRAKGRVIVEKSDAAFVEVCADRFDAAELACLADVARHPPVMRTRVEPPCPDRQRDRDAFRTCMDARNRAVEAELGHCTEVLRGLGDKIDDVVTY